MTMVELLSHKDRDDLLLALIGWETVEGRDAICRQFNFANFGAAFAFMTRVALVAEKADHHTERYNVYDTVYVVLTTNDAGGLSHRDVALTRSINALLDEEQPQGYSS